MTKEALRQMQMVVENTANPRHRKTAQIFMEKLSDALARDFLPEVIERHTEIPEGVRDDIVSFKGFDLVFMQQQKKRTSYITAENGCTFPLHETYANILRILANARGANVGFSQIRETIPTSKRGGPLMTWHLYGYVNEINKELRDHKLGSVGFNVVVRGKRNDSHSYRINPHFIVK